MDDIPILDKPTINSVKKLVIAVTSFSSGSFLDLLSRKGLPHDVWFAADFPRSQDTMEQHAQWIATNIYRYPYVQDQAVGIQNIARFFHGVQHVCRAAAYVPPWASFLRHYVDGLFASFTDVTLRMLLIAIFLHDSARENEGEDLWDCDSAAILFYYLYRCGFDRDLSLKIAEAMANKDCFDNAKEMYWQLEIASMSADTFVWCWVSRDLTEEDKHNPYVKIIHDADCLDVQRVRTNFDGRRLELYKTVAHHNPEALRILGLLIADVRRLIDEHCDGISTYNVSEKVRYEQAENPYAEIVASFNKRDAFPVLSALYGDGKLLPHDIIAESIGRLLMPADDFIQRIWQAGELYLRGILLPSAAREYREEMSTNAEVELSLPKGSLRSMVWFGPSTMPFYSTGFLIPEQNCQLTHLALINACTGCGDNRDFSETIPATEHNIISFKRQFTLRELGYYNEVIVNFSGSDPYLPSAIYFYNCIPFSVRTSGYRLDITPQLEAYHLLQLINKMHGIELPIYHIVNNRPKRVELLPEQISTLWHDAARAYADRWQDTLTLTYLESRRSTLGTFLSQSKVEMLYDQVSDVASLDVRYPREMKLKTNKIILNVFIAAASANASLLRRNLLSTSGLFAERASDHEYELQINQLNHLKLKSITII